MTKIDKLVVKYTDGYNGEHATSVNGKGNPSLDDMIVIGLNNKMSEKRCREIANEVKDNCRDLLLNDSLF